MTERKRVFDTKSHSWAEVGLARQLSSRAVKRARFGLITAIALMVATIYVFDRRKELLGVDDPARYATVAILLVLGFFVARDLGRSLRPMMFRRLDPGSAGSASFLIRLTTLVLAVFVALRIGGVDPHTLAFGGAATVVFLG